jgi:hypothetical protein
MPLCECGCGERTSTRRARWVNGHRPPVRIKRLRWVAEDRGFETPCWIWQLGVDVHGYGKTTRAGVRLKAHRVAYEEARGPIPAGHDVHHRCEQKRRVNPAHLEAVLPSEHNAHHARQRYAA